MPLHTGMRERFLKQSGISIYFIGKTGMDKGTVPPVFFVTKCACILEIFVLKPLTSCYIFTGLTQVAFIVVTV